MRRVWPLLLFAFAACGGRAERDGRGEPDGSGGAIDGVGGTLEATSGTESCLTENMVKHEGSDTFDCPGFFEDCGLHDLVCDKGQDGSYVSCYCDHLAREPQCDFHFQARCNEPGDLSYRCWCEDIALDDDPCAYYRDEDEDVPCELVCSTDPPHAPGTCWCQLC